MKKRLAMLLATACFMGSLFVMEIGRCETREIHGADSSFRVDFLGIVWGMLRGDQGAPVQVIIRVRVLGDSPAPYAAYAVQAVEPLSGATDWVARRRPLESVNDVVSPREVFKEMTGRRLLFYRQAAGASEPAPDLVIYYMGVPDTTPEFADAGQMEKYFELAFNRLAQR
jgi:hypothetical protein